MRLTDRPGRAWFATAVLIALAFIMIAGTTAMAQPYTLTVQSGPAGLSIGSGTGHGGTTDYTLPGVAQGTSVNLAAPATDPAGYTFSQWTLNSAAQTAGQKSITFTMTADTTAVAQYTASTSTLAVQSLPPTGLSIGSSTGHNGTTNYTLAGAAPTVNLVAPASDPFGYTFLQWTLNGAAQPAGLKSITFTMTTNTTAVAQYESAPSPNTLWVQSTPPTGVSIGSSTGHTGVTNYGLTNIAQGTSVNLQAPATDSTSSYAFSQWTLNGTPQAAGQQSLTFTMGANTTAVAQYTPILYTLSVQSTPPSGLTIVSSTGHVGTTNYAVTGVAAGTSVNLVAPATDLTGSDPFLYWTLNGAAQTSGQQTVTFTMTADTAAVAVYASGGLSVTLSARK